ncbi:MAG: hypothetical protein GXO76_08635 [Calditrichaeota bacterium]|nr:hypothetical protein [Calditrichota bacterium]
MLELETFDGKFEEVKEEKPLLDDPHAVAHRPEIVDAKVYKLKSGFVSHAVYVTLGYVEENGRKRPIEIFINSKDLTKMAEYAVLTRLISAIFRKSPDPSFILEELKSIYDPNGGYLKNGKYVPSFYSEIADVIERFFVDIGLAEAPEKPVEGKHQFDAPAVGVSLDGVEILKICPKCNQRTLKVENGCHTCINPDCTYSKCDD